MKTDDREKLIKLLEKAKETYYTQLLIGGLMSRELTVEFVADYLIEHGVTIPTRCKDCIYKLSAIRLNKIDGCDFGEAYDPNYDGEFYCANGERE